MADDPTYDLEASFTVDLIVDREAGEKYANEGGSAEGGAGGAASGGGEGKWSGKVDLEGSLSSIKGVAEAINKALEGQTFQLKFSFGSLRDDIEEAIGSDPFTINLQIANLEELKDLKVETQAQPAGTATAAAGIQASPQLERTLGANPNLGTAVAGLYTVLAERGFASRGMGTKPEQLQEILRVLGTDIDKIKGQQGTVEQLLSGQADANEARPKLLSAAGQYVQEAQRGEGGSESLVSLIRDNVPLFTQPAQTAGSTQPTPTRPTAAQILGATNLAAAVMPALATATAETAVAPIVEKAAQVTEQPTAGAAVPDVRPTAKATPMGDVMSLDDLIKQTRTRLALLPPGKTGPDQDRRPFDIDPTTGDRLTAQQVVDRNQGQVPTAVSPGGKFSYSQIERGASLGVFSMLAEILDERGKGTGRYQRFDPSDTENPAVRELLAGRVAQLGDARARGLRPSDALEKIARGAATTGGGGIVPPEDFEVGPGGDPEQAFALRVFRKLVPKQAAQFMRGFRHIDRPQMMRSAEHSTEEYAKADLEYVAAWEQLGQLEDEMAGQSLSARQKKEYEDRINRARSNMDRLVSERGADPGSVVVASMSPLQRMAALRERRESEIERNLEEYQPNVANRVGVSPYTLADERQEAAKVAQNNDIAMVAQGRLIKLRREMERYQETGGREGLGVSAENLPPGYEDLGTSEIKKVSDRYAAGPYVTPEQRERLHMGTETTTEQVPAKLDTATFIRQHVTAILDDFRESIGERRTGVTDAPSGFSEVLSPYVSAAFELARDEISGRAMAKGGPFGTPVRDPGGIEGSPRGVSRTEQDIVRAEAAAHRGTLGMPTHTTEQRRRIEEAKAARPIRDTPLEWEAVQLRGMEYARPQPDLLGKPLQPAVGGPRPDVASNDREAMRRAEGLRESPGWQLAMFAGGEAPSQEQAQREADAARYRERSREQAFAGAEPTRDLRGKTTGEFFGFKPGTLGASMGVATPPPSTDIRPLIHQEEIERSRPQAEEPTSVPAVAAGQLDIWGQERLDRVRMAQDAAWNLIYETAGSGQYGPGGRPLSGDETAKVISSTPGIDEDVRKEADALIRGGYAAPLFQKPEGVAGLSGDETRAAAAQSRLVAGEMAAGAAGGGRGGPPKLTGLSGGPPPDDRSSRYDGLTPGGQVQVIIAGQTRPVAVTLSMGGAQVGDPRAAAAAASHEKFIEARQQIFATREGGPSEPGVAAGQIGMFEEPASGPKGVGAARLLMNQLRQEGRSDAAIKRFLNKQGFGGAAEYLFDEGTQEEAAGGGPKSISAGLTSLRRRMGMEPYRRAISSPRQDRADELAAQYGAEAEAADRRILSRGFQASLTDFFQAPFFEGQRMAVDRFRRESSQLVGAEKTQATREDELVAALQVRNEAIRRVRSAETPEAKESAQSELMAARRITREGISSVRQARADVAEQRVRVEGGRNAAGEMVTGARAALPGTAAALGNLAIGSVAGAGAIALASVVFQVTQQLMQTLEQQLGDAAQKAADRLLGFADTAARVGDQLSDMTRSMGGNAQAAIWTQFGATGMPTAQAAVALKPLENRAAIEAGQKALAEQVDLLRAARNFDRGELGLLQPEGGIPGLTRSTGGAFGMPVGGTPDVLQSMVHQLPGWETHDWVTGAFPNITEAQDKLHSFLMGREGVYQELVPDQQTQREFEATVKGWNESLDAAKVGLRLFTGATEEESVRLSKILEAGGASELDIQRLRDLQVGVTDDQGNQLSDTMIGAFGKDLASALLGGIALQAKSPTVESIMGANQLQLQNQISLQAAQFAFGRQQIPMEFGMQQAASPTIDPSRRLEAMGVQVTDEFKGLFQQVADEAAAGQRAAIDFVTNGTQIPGMGTENIGGLGPQKGQAFADALKRAADYGQQIASIQLDVQTEQAAYAAHQFANSIYIANRSLSDAKALAGGIGSEFGKIQRQQWELGRESQSLSMALTQRQINFRIATAGITQPGMTPEMRAASVAQAKLEAKYAQEQLDIQRELFKLAGRGFQITADRNVRDLGRSLALLREGYKVQLHTAEAEEKIKALTALQKKENDNARKYYDEAIASTNTVLDLINKVASSAQKAMQDVADEVIRGFRKEYRAIIGAIEDYWLEIYTGAIPGSQTKQHTPAATGLLFDTSGPTNLTVGEAGTETVAILRNPRQAPVNSGGGMFSGTSGGSPTVNIIFNGPVIKKEEDLRRIAREIERILGQRASLLYGRNI